jgi:hypothetical protein
MHGALGLLSFSLGCGSDARPPPSPAIGAAGSGGPVASAGAAGMSGAGGSAMASGGGSGAAGNSGAGGAPSALEPSCIPRQNCQRLCSSLGADPASCGVGDAEQCGCICEERFNGPCPDELAVLLSCTGDAPSIDCSINGRIFPGCERESLSLQLCDFRAREQLCAQAFPACTPLCQALTLSFCPQGPESITSCLCGCEQSLATRCASEFSSFMSCSDGAPQFSCDSAGKATPQSCATEWQALESCSTPPAPALDAGG